MEAIDWRKICCWTRIIIIIPWSKFAVQVFNVAVTVKSFLHKFSQFTSMLERFLSNLPAKKTLQTTLEWNGDSIPIIGMQFLKQSVIILLVWIDHFTVVCLVAWPLNESEAGVDLVLIETSQLFICKFLLISMRTASLTWEKQGGFYQNKVTFSLTFIQSPSN